MRKKSFYRAFNAIFAKVGRLASEEVIIQLLRTKCLPILYYGLEACPVTKAQTKSLDYALHSCFRKIFSTRDHVVVNHCMACFDFSYVSEAVKCKQQGSFNDIRCHLIHCVYCLLIWNARSDTVLVINSGISIYAYLCNVVFFGVLLWGVQCVCMDFSAVIFSLPEMVNKVEYIIRNN